MGKCKLYVLLIWIFWQFGLSLAGNSCTVGGKTTYCDHGCCGELPNEECCPIATWIIVVSALGGLLGAGIAVSVVVCCCMKNRYQRRKMAQTAPTAAGHDINRNTPASAARTYRKDSFKSHRPMPLFFSRKPAQRAHHPDDDSMELPPLRAVTGTALQERLHAADPATDTPTKTKLQPRNQAFEHDNPAHQQQQQNQPQQQHSQQRRGSLVLQRRSSSQLSSPASQHDQRRRPSGQLAADKRNSLTAQVLQQLEHVSSQLYHDREKLFSRADQDREPPPRSPSVQLHGDRDLYFLEQEQPPKSQHRRVSIQLNDDQPMFTSNYVPGSVLDFNTPSEMVRSPSELRSPSVLGDRDLHAITQDYERRTASAMSTKTDPSPQRRPSAVQIDIPEEDHGPEVRSIISDRGIRSPSVMLRGDSDLNAITQDYERGRASVLSNVSGQDHLSVFTIKSRQASRSAVPGTRHVNYKQQRRLSVPGTRDHSEA